MMIVRHCELDWEASYITIVKKGELDKKMKYIISAM